MPFTLVPGQPRVLTVDFAPGDSAYAFCNFTVHGDECMGRNFYADGGWRGKASPRIKVRILRPNGGEGFVVANDEVLTWDNVMPDEKVRLEYSIDNGATWRLIADSATGLTHVWHVPRTPSNTCLLRATAHMPVNYLENFAEVPEGTFSMGDITGNGTFAEERPVHQVRITRPLMMGRTEVTQAQWLTVMNDNPSLFKGDSLPVEGVRWIDAVEFCNRLSILEKLDTCYTWSGGTVQCNFNASGFRLPTEAEWEYACRAGTTTDFYSGDMTQSGCDPLDQALDRAGWYCGNENQRTRQVGLKEPNAFGLFDMHGNVFEWCWDWYADNAYSGAPATDPTGPATGVTRVVRSGSWAGSADLCRSSRRSGNYPTDRFDDIGFRIVRLK
jgi:formylglycine-generating enzyme required for sulfatase activity